MAGHTTTKREIIARISDRTGINQVVVKDLMEAFVDEIINSLAKGDRVELRGFGVFEVNQRHARSARNPKTGQIVHIPARRTISVRAGKLMREMINAPLEENQGGGSGTGPHSPDAAQA